MRTQHIDQVSRVGKRGGMPSDGCQNVGLWSREGAQVSRFFNQRVVSSGKVVIQNVLQLNISS